MHLLPAPSSLSRSTGHGAIVGGRSSYNLQTQLPQPSSQPEPLARIWRHPRRRRVPSMSAYASDGIAGPAMHGGDPGRSEAGSAVGPLPSSPHPSASTVDASVAGDEHHLAATDGHPAGRPSDTASSSTTLIKAFHLVRMRLSHSQPRVVAGGSPWQSAALMLHEGLVVQIIKRCAQHAGTGHSEGRAWPRLECEIPDLLRN